jgi:hypothetical protein
VGLGVVVNEDGGAVLVANQAVERFRKAIAAVDGASL